MRREQQIISLDEALEQEFMNEAYYSNYEDGEYNEGISASDAYDKFFEDNQGELLEDDYERFSGIW